MGAAEVIGYVASVLGFATFYMKTMVALRCFGLAANVAFICYGYLESLFPILILHSLQLPVNLIRLRQILGLVNKATKYRGGGVPLEPLIPFMRERSIHDGEVLFRKGDRSTGMFYLAEGQVRIPEIDALIQPGEFFGEVSLFAPDNRRTGSAVVETPGTVFWLSERSVALLFFQSPQVGYALIRLITGRLLDNFRHAGASVSTKQDTVRPVADEPKTPRAVMPDPEKVDEAQDVLRRARWGRRFAAAALVAIPLLLLIGTIYSQHSYVASVIFRDAVVTNWVYTATAPISGQVGEDAPEPGKVFMDDGRVMFIRNLQANDTDVKRIAAEIERTEARIEELTREVEQLRFTQARWEERTQVYADVFRDALSLELEGLKDELAFVEKQLGLSARVAARLGRLAQQGNASLSQADESTAQIMALRSEKSELDKKIAHTQRRFNAARAGIFITADGNNPDWVFDSNDVLELRLIEAADELATARGSLAKLQDEARAAEDLLWRTSEAEVRIRPQSIVWSVATGPGSTVGRGAPLFRWIQCSELLIDVPVSDVGLSLLRQGMQATVKIEGIADELSGELVYTRGAAGRLNQVDLAATADSGDGQLAQALVRLTGTEFPVERCPVGRAAFVDFPDIGPLDRLLAYLRF